MTTFHATYFDGLTSQPHAVMVTIRDDVLRIDGPDMEPVELELRSCVITPPLGKTSRVIRLPGNRQLETTDDQAVSALEWMLGANQGMHAVNRLERYWIATAVCFGGLIVSVWLFMVYGIPVAAERIARAVPISLTESISQRTLAFFDEKLLTPSELEPQKAQQVHDAFRSLVHEVGSRIDYRLELRKSDDNIGANAFALPSGIIIMTDALIKIADNDRQIIGVMVHEIGHVEKRHAMRSLIQNAGVFFVISALVGDIASITSTASTLPMLLAETGYSRNFEREADTFSGNYSMAKGWGTKPMIAMLQKISRHDIDFPGKSILSTHPETQERVAHLQEIEANYLRY